MKFTKILSITGVMLMSTQLNAAAVENNQIMPPPGPYKSIMSNTPPAFVPYGSQQVQNNPYQQNQPSQTFNRFPSNNQAFQKPAEQLPEWVISKKQENKARFEKMLEENAKRNKENEKRFAEYLEKAEALAKKRNEEHKKWVAENNKKMKEFWQSELDKFAKNQKLQIEKAKDLPDWVRKNMLERQEKQLAVMKENPPMPMQNSMQRNSPSKNGFNNMQQSPPVHQAPSSMQFRQPPFTQQQQQQQQPAMNQPFNTGQQYMPRQFMQQPRQAPLIQQQYRPQPRFNMPENRQFVPPVQGPYSGPVSGQPNINPYNRYSR